MSAQVSHTATSGCSTSGGTSKPRSGVGYAYSPLTLYGRCNTIIEEKTIHYFGLTKVGLSIMYMF